MSGLKIFNIFNDLHIEPPDLFDVNLSEANLTGVNLTDPLTASNLSEQSEGLNKLSGDFSFIQTFEAITPGRKNILQPPILRRQP